MAGLLTGGGGQAAGLLSQQGHLLPGIVIPTNMGIILYASTFGTVSTGLPVEDNLVNPQ